MSCDIKLIKPDAAIFRHTVGRPGLRPQETLFVDDREANIEAAQEVGLNVIPFESVEQLRVELEKMRFEILPRDS